MNHFTSIILSLLLSVSTHLILSIVFPESYCLITMIEIVFSPVKHYLVNYLSKKITTRKTE